MSNDLFTFTHDGGEYSFEKPFKAVLTPRFLRHNRRRGEMDLVFTILEEIAGDDVLDVLDDMSPEQFADFGEQFKKALAKAMGASLGE